MESDDRKRLVLRWIRVVVVLALGLAVCLPILFAVAWTRFAGGRWGWLSSLLTFGLLGLVVGWAAVPGRWRRARTGTAIALAVTAGVLGIATAHFAPATPGRLRAQIEAYAQPGWKLDHDEVAGNAICFDYCTSVSRTYHADTAPDVVLSALRPRLPKACPSPPLGIGPQGWTCDASDNGDIDLRIEIRPWNRGTQIAFTATASSP